MKEQDEVGAAVAVAAAVTDSSTAAPERMMPFASQENQTQEATTPTSASATATVPVSSTAAEVETGSDAAEKDAEESFTKSTEPENFTEKTPTPEASPMEHADRTSDEIQEEETTVLSSTMTKDVLTNQQSTTGVDEPSAPVSLKKNEEPADEWPASAASSLTNNNNNNHNMPIQPPSFTDHLSENESSSASRPMPLPSSASSSSSTTPPPCEQERPAPSLTELPVDALLHITRYDTVSHAGGSWARVHTTCAAVTRQAFFQMHRQALVCAWQIATACYAHEWADAQALVQLYQSYGMDVYPAAPPEHVWKTLAWRWQIQVRDDRMRTHNNQNNSTSSNHTNTASMTSTQTPQILLATLDPFLAHMALQQQQQLVQPQQQHHQNNAANGPPPQPQNRPNPHNTNYSTTSYVAQKERFHQAQRQQQQHSPPQSQEPKSWMLHEHLWNHHYRQRTTTMTPPFPHATNRRTQPLHLAADMDHWMMTTTTNTSTTAADPLFLPEHAQLYSAQQPLSPSVPHQQNPQWGTAQKIYKSYAQRLATMDHHSPIDAVRRLFCEFWDALLPATQYVAFWDAHTAVPRTECLAEFTQRPLPKSWGIVQCEIERHKKKRLLFPQYEYRLFIRQEVETAPADDNNNNPRRPTTRAARRNGNQNNHHNIHNPVDPNAESDDEDDDNGSTVTQRHDVPLLSAQPLGKKAGSAKESKKQSKTTANHYGLYLPPDATVASEGSTTRGKSVGRLQGNFIGTEFQLFVPSAEAKRSSPVRSSSSPLSPHRLPPSRTVSLPVGFASSDGEEEEDCIDNGDEVVDMPEEIEEGYGSDPATTRRSNPTGKRRSRLRFSRFLRSSSNLSSSPSTNTGERLQGDITSSPEPHKRHISRRAIANESLSASDNNIGSSSPSRRIRPNEEENAVITYTANLLGSRPRIMDVCIPRVDEQNMVNPNAGWKEQGMLTSFKRLQQRGDAADNTTNNAAERRDVNNPGNETDANAPAAGNGPSSNGAIPEEPSANTVDLGLWALQNRPPWWNVELGSFVLNFGGRVSVASVKNFQLVDRAHNLRNLPGDNADATILLQFGRIQGRHSFTMDFQHPLSPVQAFSIAISSLQSKISFG